MHRPSVVRTPRRSSSTASRMALAISASRPCNVSVPSNDSRTRAARSSDVSTMTNPSKRELPCSRSRCPPSQSAAPSGRPPHSLTPCRPMITRRCFRRVEHRQPPYRPGLKPPRIVSASLQAGDPVFRRDASPVQANLRQSAGVGEILVKYNHSSGEVARGSFVRSPGSQSIPSGVAGFTDQDGGVGRTRCGACFPSIEEKPQRTTVAENLSYSSSGRSGSMGGSSSAPLLGMGAGSGKPEVLMARRQRFDWTFEVGDAPDLEVCFELPHPRGGARRQLHYWTPIYVPARTFAIVGAKQRLARFLRDRCHFGKDRIAGLMEAWDIARDCLIEHGHIQG